MRLSAYAKKMGVTYRTAFRWWTTYEEFPEFLDGVTRVQRAGNSAARPAHTASAAAPASP